MNEKKTLSEVNQIVNAIDDLTNNQLVNLRSDFTGWNIVEAIESIAHELKRFNDREEGVK